MNKEDHSNLLVSLREEIAKEVHETWCIWVESFLDNEINISEELQENWSENLCEYSHLDNDGKAMPRVVANNLLKVCKQFILDSGGIDGLLQKKECEQTEECETSEDPEVSEDPEEKEKVKCC